LGLLSLKRIPSGPRRTHTDTDTDTDTDTHTGDSYTLRTALGLDNYDVENAIHAHVGGASHELK